jgi:hypothetical protein
MDLRETGWEAVDWMKLVQDRDQWQALLNMIWTSGFHKTQGISWLSVCWLLKKETCVWSQ